MVDLSNLSPAPWRVFGPHEYVGRNIPEGSDYPMLLVEDEENPHDVAALEFVVLARNAFDVMMRQGWGLSCELGVLWSVTTPAGELVDCPKSIFDDPFTALVESDRWYRENVENQT